jgi:pimeloyl-ACP methyl ester carboxylesterase
MPLWSRDQRPNAQQGPTAQQSASEASSTPLTPQVVTFTSADGVPIGCYRSGTGPALVAVHGGAADHTSWDPVAPRLARRFTVYAMDRRGRGASGDAPGYSLEREIDDVLTVVDGIGQPVHLYGHSFGGTCAIEAAMRTRHLVSLTLYEGGPKPPGNRFIPDEFITQLETLIAQGQREEALRLFMLHGAGLNPQELEVLRRTPAWARRLAAVHTIPRELRALNEYGTDLNRFKALAVPTLLLVGGQTEGRRRDIFLVLNGMIQGSRVHELAGQGHAAHQTAPDLLADTLTEFLLAVDSAGAHADA